MYNKDNFFNGTIANFSSVSICRIPNRPTDYVSESGSRYWYDERGVYRMADHWGDVSSCYWTFNFSAAAGLSVGFCSWSKFVECTGSELVKARDRQKSEAFKRAEKWQSKMTNKEVKAVEDAEAGCRERKGHIFSALLMISERISVPMTALEGSHVTVSWCVWSDFPSAYTRRYSPEGTVIRFVFRGGRPRVEHVSRSVTSKRMSWELTAMAKDAVAETMNA